MALLANALTELQTVKDELGITVTTDDALIERYITAVSSAIVSFCRREFARAAVTEKIAGKGTPLLMLSQTPIVSMTSLDENGAALVEDEDYEIHDDGAGLLRRTGYAFAWYTYGSGGINNDPMIGMERKLITAAYEGGYTTPHQITEAIYPGPSTLPAVVEEAAILSVVSRYESRGADRRVSNERLMDASISYAARNKITGRGMGGVLVDEAIDMLRPFCHLEG